MDCKEKNFKNGTTVTCRLKFALCIVGNITDFTENQEMHVKQLLILF